MNLQSMICPNCGGQLYFEEGQEKCFCSHCGTQVVLSDENKKTYIYKTIDVAKVTRAETDRIVKMSQLNSEKTNDSLKIKAVIAWAIVCAILLIFGIIGFSFGNEAMGMICIFSLIFVFLFGLMFGIELFEQKPKKILDENNVSLEYGMQHVVGKNYVEAESYFRSAGFINIKSVPLNDLPSSAIKKNGKVVSASVNGSHIIANEVYSKNDEVIITYHSPLK